MFVESFAMNLGMHDLWDFLFLLPRITDQFVSIIVTRVAPALLRQATYGSLKLGLYHTLKRRLVKNPKGNHEYISKYYIFRSWFCHYQQYQVCWVSNFTLPILQAVFIIMTTCNNSHQCLKTISAFIFILMSNPIIPTTSCYFHSWFCWCLSSQWFFHCSCGGHLILTILFKHLNWIASNFFSLPFIIFHVSHPYRNTAVLT